MCCSIALIAGMWSWASRPGFLLWQSLAAAGMSGMSRRLVELFGAVWSGLIRNDKIGELLGFDEFSGAFSTTQGELS